jgi:hypothetical protein
MAIQEPKRRGYFRPSKSLTMVQVFDGRLRLYGIHEFDGWGCFADTLEAAIPAGFDPSCRVLTDWFCYDKQCENYCDADCGNTVVVQGIDAVIFRCSLTDNKPYEILSTIEQAFDVKLTCERVETDDWLHRDSD